MGRMPSNLKDFITKDKYSKWQWKHGKKNWSSIINNGLMSEMAVNILLSVCFQYAIFKLNVNKITYICFVMLLYCCLYQGVYVFVRVCLSYC